jgi:hypothetical protein
MNLINVLQVVRVAALPFARLLLGLLFDRQDGGGMLFLRNGGWLIYCIHSRNACVIVG